MTGVKPMIVFLHYFGRGPADKLARGVRAAVDQLGNGGTKTTRNILFLCPHGAAKSVLATAYFKEKAARGLDVRAQAAGTEPEPAVAPAVVERLKAQELEVPVTTPRLVAAEDLGRADMVITLGCDLAGRTVRGDLRRWDDVPSPSADFAGADAAIRRHVDVLVDELVRDGR